MPLLPARIPQIPEDRAGVVPARLARKVGPLFGVAWDDGPFGPRTWVSDHSRITLSEIARGAPQPTRAQAGRLPSPARPWTIVDRIGITENRGDLPNEIANATLNRFGPDTRSAVLLTAVNRLLDPVGEAIGDALALLRDDAGRPLVAELRLAGWAALVVETFRSQPALFAAGIGARTIQRELVAGWDLPRSPSLAGTPFTRCEISSTDRARSPSQPCDLDVVDATFTGLGLDDPGEPALARRLRHDETVDRLLRRLRAAGTLQDSSHLWLSERRPGEVVVEALIPPTRLVHDFVTRVLPHDPDPALPEPPDPGRLRPASPTARRALLLAILGVLRQVLAVPSRRERSREGVVAVAARTAALADAVLDADDPVRPLVRCRASLITVQTLRHDTDRDLREPLRDVLDAADACTRAHRAGGLDRGALAEILAAANIEVNAVRQSNAADASAGLPPPAELDRWLRRSWAVYLEALETAPDRLADPGAGMIGFHLHNYAAFLASHRDSPEDLRAATELYRGIVVPARERFVERGGSFEPLRHALQIASRATCSQAAAAVASGDVAGARRDAAQGLRWMRTVLDDPGTRSVLADTTEQAYRLALLAAPALLLGTELAAPGHEPGDLAVVATLLDTARRWERSTPAGARGSHARHDELVELEGRLARAGDTRSHGPARTPHPA